MKKIILILVLAIGFSSVLNAQIHNPVKWNTSVNKISETDYELIITAQINHGWHLYSQEIPEGGPIATTFIYESSVNYLKKGNTKEEKGVVVNDKMFGMKIKYFSKKAMFKQRIKVKSKKEFKINAVVEYMVCDDTQCLPPKEKELIFIIK